MESLYELWGKRNPEWEERYQESVISVFSDYGKGVNQYQEVRGKIYGAGYEVFILAFFIGLYNDKTKPLIEDKAKRKHFGWAISNWGTGESRPSARFLTDTELFRGNAETSRRVGQSYSHECFCKSLA